MHSYQSPMAEDTPQLPHIPQVSQTTDGKDATDALNSAASHTHTTSGKIRRMPSAIRLLPYEQDTTALSIIALATEVAGQPYQNTYILDAPQTPAPQAERVAALPQLLKEAAVMHTLPLNSSQEKVLQPRNYARALYIPPMILRSREPDEGEVLLGCCTLLILSIVITCSLYYFLIHVH